MHKPSLATDLRPFQPPWGQVLDGMCEAAERDLAGNSIHLHVMGCIVAFVLACAVPCGSVTIELPLHSELMPGVSSASGDVLDSSEDADAGSQQRPRAR